MNEHSIVHTHTHTEEVGSLHNGSPTFKGKDKCKKILKTQYCSPLNCST